MTTRLPLTPYDTVCVSGGFDPLHIGHLRLMKEAAEYGNLIVIVNSDDWLMRKKGYIFMPFDERCEILQGLGCVGETSFVDDADGTVCEALKRLRPTYFANGGDRKNTNTPEMALCQELGIELLWQIGGFKIQSSSELVTTSPMLIRDSLDHADEDLRPSRVEIVSAGDIRRPHDK